MDCRNRMTVMSELHAVELRATREGRGVGAEVRVRLAIARVANDVGDEAELVTAVALAAQRNQHELYCDMLVAKARWLGAAGRTNEALDWSRCGG
jgi:hypothetical protein